MNCSQFYLFKLEYCDSVVQDDVVVRSRNGDLIGFIDHRPHDTCDILELMHRAFEIGKKEGREKKSSDLRKILNI